MNFNDYIMKAWNKVANSAPISRVAAKTYQPKFNDGPTVLYNTPQKANRQKQHGIGGQYYPDNRMITINEPRGSKHANQILGHELAHDRFMRNPNQYNNFMLAAQKDPYFYQAATRPQMSALYGNKISPNETYAYGSTLVDGFRNRSALTINDIIRNKILPSEGRHKRTIEPDILDFY